MEVVDSLQSDHMDDMYVDNDGAYSESKNTEAIIQDVTNQAEDLFFPTEVETGMPYAQEEEEEPDQKSEELDIERLQLEQSQLEL